VEKDEEKAEAQKIFLQLVKNNSEATLGKYVSTGNVITEKTIYSY